MSLWNMGLSFKNMIIALLLSVVTTNQDVLLAIFVLGIIDFISGVIAAKVQNVSITSARMKDSIIKLTLYMTTVIICAIAEQHLLSFIPLVRIIGALIGLVELISVLENVNNIKQIRSVSFLIKFLRSKEREIEKSAEEATQPKA